MAYSLQSRDIIADGIETVMGAQYYDALLSIPGCDKNMSGRPLPSLHWRSRARFTPFTLY